VEAESLPSGLTARVLYRGDYAGLGAAYDEVQQWLTEHAYAASGPPWESYLHEPEVDQPRTVVQFPCVRVARE
jgi:effector-binding domain-containing protein